MYEFTFHPIDGLTPATIGRFDAVVGGFVEAAMVKIAESAASLTPYAEMAASFVVERTTPDTLTLTNTDPIFPFREVDIAPHDIPGAWGRPLPFGVGGRFDGRFHPGSAGVHMLERAWDEGRPALQAGFEAGLAAFLLGGQY